MAVVVVSGLIAFVGCLPVFELVPGDDRDAMLAVLALPGVFLTGMVAESAKSFRPWVIFGFTWLFYAVVLSVLVLLYRSLRWALNEK